MSPYFAINWAGWFSHMNHYLATVLIAMIPLAETFGYTTDLRSLTQGRATFSLEFDHYEEVPAHVAEKISGARVAKPARA